jgi:hypothetical protein
MKAFNLKEALAGEKVMDNDGDEVTQITHFNANPNNQYCVFGVCLGVIVKYTVDGFSGRGTNLFMAPKKLSGFINDYVNHSPTWHSTREAADMDFNTKEKRLACIDLSQFEEGYGL